MTSFAQDLTFGDIYPMPLEDNLCPSKWQSVKDMPRVNRFTSTKIIDITIIIIIFSDHNYHTSYRCHRMPFSSKTPRLIPPVYKKTALDGVQYDLSDRSKLRINLDNQNNRDIDTTFSGLSDFTEERIDGDICSMKSYQSEVYGYGNGDLTEDNTGDDSDSDNDLGRFYTVEHSTLSLTSKGYIYSKSNM
jgi:hypothetical protein